MSKKAYIHIQFRLNAEGKSVCHAHLLERLHVFIHESNTPLWIKLPRNTWTLFLSLVWILVWMVAIHALKQYQKSHLTMLSFSLFAKFDSDYHAHTHKIHSGVMKFAWSQGRLAYFHRFFSVCIPMEFIDASCTFAIIFYSRADYTWNIRFKILIEISIHVIRNTNFDILYQKHDFSCFFFTNWKSWM